MLSLPSGQRTYPLIDLFERALEFGRDDAPAARFAKIEAALARHGLAQPETVSLWAGFLSVPVPDQRPPLNLTPQRQKQKTFESIAALALALASEQPLLLIMEDLHWADPSTRELIDLVFGQVSAASILMLLTSRPEFQPPWGNRSHLTHLTVNRVTRKQTELMVDRMTGGKPLPAEILRQVVAKTDGVPLFVEELTKMVLESGLLRDATDRYELTGVLPPLAIPSTLQDSLMARLDRLATVKEVAQVGAALGRSFHYELLRAIASIDDRSLRDALVKLGEAELLHQRGMPPDATYIFKHALIQETAYGSMLKGRRQQLHQRIARALVERFPEAEETQPELLAHHYTEAGLPAEAVEWWRRAGQRSLERSANVEAIAHLKKGLEVLKSLADSPGRTERELELQRVLGVALSVSKGWGDPEAELAHARVRELCRHAGDSHELFSAILGVAGASCVRGDIRFSRELSEQGLCLAERLRDPTLLVIGHFNLADHLFWFPELVSARGHLEEALALYDPMRDRSRALLVVGFDPGVASLAFLSRVLWHLGYPDQAAHSAERAIALADEIAHPFSQSWALSWGAALYQLRREPLRVLQLGEAAVRLASEQAIAFFGAHGMVFRGWALLKRGQPAEGMSQLRDGIAAYRATGAEVERSHWLGLLAEACGDAGQPEEGLQSLAGALEEIKRNGINYYEAELHRLRGELLVARSDANGREAEASFREAIEIASRQQAKLVELRATTSLSRLLQRQGKREDAARMLANVYDWFREGFATEDFRAAKLLLEELSMA